MKMLAMEYSANHISSAWRIRLISVFCAVVWMIACAAVLPAAEEEARIDAEPYLKQLKVEREESWLREQMLRFGNFRHLDRAYRLIDEGRLADAKEEFERYLSNDNTDLEARANYLYLLYRMKDYQNVLNQASLILNQRPVYIPARMYMGFAHQRLGALEKALEDFRRVSVTPETMQADKVLALNTAADLAILLERYSEALEFMQAIPEENRDGIYWFRKGLTHERTGNPAAAVESYRRAIRVSQDVPFQVTVHRTLFNLAMRQEDLDAAAEELKAALELLPGDPELTRSYRQISFDVEMRNGRYREALAMAETLARDQGGPSDWMRVGTTLEKLGRWKEAAEAYSRAEALAGDKQQKILAWRSAAEAAKKAWDWPMAEQALMNLQKLEPGRPETLRGLSVAAYRQEKLAEAIRWMELSLSVKEDLDDREFLANLYMEAGDYDRVVATRQFILRGVRDPSNRHRHYMSIGFAYSQAGRADEAAAAFSRAVELQQDLPTLVPLAQALEDAGKLQQAEKYRSMIVSIQPSGANRLALAMLYLKLGEETSALKELESAVHSDMDEDRLFIALKQLALLYQKQGRIDEVEETLSRAQSLDAGDTFIPLMLAEIALESGDYATALEDTEKALAGGVTIRGLKMRALIFQEMGDLDKSQADYEKALKMLPEDNPEVPSLLVQIGNLEFALHRYPEAAEQFLKAFELRPSGDVHLLVQAAESLALARNWQAATKINKRILDLPLTSQKEKADAYRRLGNIYMQRGESRLAEESLRNALATGEADSRTHAALGMLLFGQKRYDEARSSFSAALEQRESAQELLYLARTFAAMKKTGMAIYCIQKALSEFQSLDPAERDSLYRELGYLYAEIHEYTKALEAWAQSESAVRAPEVQLAMARMQRLLGNFAEAEKILVALVHWTKPT